MSTETQVLIDEVPQLKRPRRRETLRLTPEESIDDALLEWEAVR